MGGRVSTLKPYTHLIYGVVNHAGFTGGDVRKIPVPTTAERPRAGSWNPHVVDENVFGKIQSQTHSLVTDSLPRRAKR